MAEGFDAELEVDDKRPITCQRRQVYDKVLNMGEISSGLVAVAFDQSDDHGSYGTPLVRLSDAEAIIAQKDAEILEQCRLNGIGAEREAALLGKVAQQSAALKLARDALIGALSDDQPYINASKEALATIDALGELK